MAMSIRGLPDDVKARLEHGAKAEGRSLNAHVVDILSRYAGEQDRSLAVAKAYAGKSTYEDMLEARKIEEEHALDWRMSYDDPPGR